MGKVNRFINYGGAAGQVGGDLSHRASFMLKTLFQNLKLKQKLGKYEKKSARLSGNIKIVAADSLQTSLLDPFSHSWSFGE